MKTEIWWEIESRKGCEPWQTFCTFKHKPSKKYVTTLPRHYEGWKFRRVKMTTLRKIFN